MYQDFVIHNIMIYVSMSLILDQTTITDILLVNVNVIRKRIDEFYL